MPPINPTTYEKTHAIAYQSSRRQRIITQGRRARYSYTPPGDIFFQLVFDGTGVANMGVAQALRAASGAGVKNEVAKFEKLCLKMNGDIHTSPISFSSDGGI